MPQTKPPIATTTSDYNYNPYSNSENENENQPPLDRLRNKARKFLLKRRKERYYRALEEHSSIYSPTERKSNSFGIGIGIGIGAGDNGNGFYNSTSNRSYGSRARARARAAPQRFHFNHPRSRTRTSGSVKNKRKTKTGPGIFESNNDKDDKNDDDRGVDNLSPLLPNRKKTPIPDYSSVGRAQVLTTAAANNASTTEKKTSSSSDSQNRADVEVGTKEKDQAQAQSRPALSVSIAADTTATRKRRSYSDYNSSHQHRLEQHKSFHLASEDSTDSFLKITFTTDSAEAFEAVDERFTAHNTLPTFSPTSPFNYKEGNSSQDDGSDSSGGNRDSNSLAGEDISFGTNTDAESEKESFFEKETSETHINMTNGNHSHNHSHIISASASASASATSGGTNSNSARRKFMKCMHCLTQNSITTCILRIPTVADYAMASHMGIILDNPKMAFLGLLVACVAVDAVIILPGYLCAKFMTEMGVYLFTFSTIFYLGRCVLRMIAFPGSTSRLRGEVETEFAKYSVRMLKNATESCSELATLLISMESASMYSMENGKESPVHDPNVKASTVLGGSYGRFDVLPLWKKASQYRDRVLGMYHDVLHCLLTENGNGTCSEEDLTKYGNNPLMGDIGKLVTVSEKAKATGMELHGLLGKLLEELEMLESCASSLLNSDMRTLEHQTLSRDAVRASQRLLVACSAFNDCLESMYALFDPDAARNDDDSDDGFSSRRKSPISEGLSTVKEGVNSFIELIDPPPFKSIFGLDSLRGSVLSRYRGSQQFWVPRSKSEGGGMVDVIHVPADGKARNLNDSTKLDKVVLFCNPNAGLLEVATGLSIIGGNVVQNGNETSSITSWTDFYLNEGFDIILFNYTGYGRSHVGKRKGADYSSGVIHFLRRMLYKIFFAFKPSPSTLKADATAVATHMLEKIGVNKLVMHGESIGGMAASGASRTISEQKNLDANGTPISYPSLLIADRTFCNLDAVASRLVGSWTDSVIPILTPFWNTDVAGDFVAARCKKVVAQDASDAIIHDASSLKKGISTAKEFMKESTKSVHNLGQLPISYRMSDYENVGVLECKTVNAPHLNHIRPPTYPADKHINLTEAFHFAACARRIGKVATLVRKNRILSSMSYDDEEGIEIPAVFSRDDSEPDVVTEREDVIVEVWEALARCDGLTGMPLGGSVKEGYDSVLDWLSCIVTLGCQRIALTAESRIKALKSSSHTTFDEIIVTDEDFDFYYPEYDKDDDMDRMPPLPLPDVIALLQNKFSANKEFLNEVQHELEYCIKMLQYVIKRISSKQAITNALKIAHFQDIVGDGFGTGRYLNLSCGHNNQYSIEERISLSAILTEALDYDNTLA